MKVLTYKNSVQPVDGKCDQTRKLCGGTDGICIENDLNGTPGVCPINSIKIIKTTKASVPQPESSSAASNEASSEPENETKE